MKMKVLKLADFGIATRLEEGKRLKAKMGTPFYMSPEQHRLPDGQGYGHPADQTLKYLAGLAG